jgi:hypothetical protein
MKRRTFLKSALTMVAFLLSSTPFGLRAKGAATSAKAKATRPMPLPPLPKWNKLTDDIDSVDFLQRSKDCERRLLPSDLVFPRSGQIWEAVHDCQVYGVRMVGPGIWTKISLREGDRVRILDLDHPKPLQVRFRPIQESEDSSRRVFLHGDRTHADFIWERGGIFQ